MAKPDLSLNHYQRLGVSVNATDAEIERAFKKLLPKFHPDKHPGDLDAAANMALINNARDVLLDSAKRKVYDFENNLGVYASQPTATSSTVPFDMNYWDFLNKFKQDIPKRKQEEPKKQEVPKETHNSQEQSFSYKNFHYSNFGFFAKPKPRSVPNPYDENDFDSADNYTPRPRASAW